MAIIKHQKFEENKKKIILEGMDKLHVLSDFDRTLTKAFVNGKKFPSMISILRDNDYLGEDYSKKAKELAGYYGKIERNNSISPETRKKAMYEWWTRHFDLLIEKKLNKKHLERLVDEGCMELREGVPEFFGFLHDKNIPLVILSSSGIGETIPMYLKKENLLYENIHVISNSYEWDSKGNAIGIKKPIIHTMNKEEASIKNLPIYDELLKRKNILLLGDSINDSSMIKGFNYENLITIGFLNEEIDKNLSRYKNSFDAVITEDGSFEFVNNFLRDFNG